jgi:hypothetical protein
MKDTRTWNRRDFAVTPNGYFSVLKPTRWFSAVPLPGGFRYLVGQSKETTSPLAHENPTENPPAAPPPRSTFVLEQKPPDHAGSQEITIPLQFTSLSTHDHQLMRPALIVLAATAITWILLWSTAHP